jgi:tetratricopeptide (TPR) repeat protein
VPRSILSTGNLRRIWVCGVLVASFLACGESHLYGCLWLYGTDPEGNSKTFNGGIIGNDQLVYEAHHPDESRERWKRNVKYFEANTSPWDYKAQNDYAVHVIRLGEAHRAIEMLKSIEKKLPGLYATAANLGTGYELAGDNERALKWIKEAIRRNPKSHGGTEWVHVRILEAKLKLEKDPKWLESHSVMALDFGQELMPHAPPAVVDYLGNKHDPKNTEDAIRHQLEERIALVPPPEPIVGDLLADLGSLAILDGVVEKALPVYELALEYHMPRPDLTRKRIEHFKQLVAANPNSLQPSSSENAHSGRDNAAAIAIAAVVGMFALVLFVMLALAFLDRPRASRPSDALSSGPKEE